MKYEAKLITDTFVPRWIVKRDGKRFFDAGYPDKANYAEILRQSEIEAKVIAWSLNQTAMGRRLTAYTIEQQPIDDEGNLEPWVSVDYPNES